MNELDPLFLVLAPVAMAVLVPLALSRWRSRHCRRDGHQPTRFQLDRTGRVVKTICGRCYETLPNDFRTVLRRVK